MRLILNTHSKYMHHLESIINDSMQFKSYILIFKILFCCVSIDRVHNRERNLIIYRLSSITIYGCHWSFTIFQSVYIACAYFFRCYFDAMEKLSFMRLQHPNQSHIQQRDKLIEVERQSQI